MNFKEAIEQDYPLIPMKDIDDEARLIAVAWHESATDWIGDKHKLASDLMNYARRKGQSLEDQQATSFSEWLIENCDDYLTYNAARRDEGIKARIEKGQWYHLETQTIRTTTELLKIYQDEK